MPLNICSQLVVQLNNGLFFGQYFRNILIFFYLNAKIFVVNKI